MVKIPLDTGIDGLTFPRTYEAQRKLELSARMGREAALKFEDGAKLPPICGFEYKPRKNRNPNVNSKIEDVATCHRVAGEGTKHRMKGLCDYHEVQAAIDITKMKGSQADKNQITVARNMAYQSAKFFGEPINLDPHTALLQEVHRTAGIVGWLEDKLAKLREDGHPDDEILIQFSKQHGLVPSVWMQLYQQERDRLIHVSTSAIKAGVAERRVQLAEQQGRLIAEILLGFIRDPALGLTPTQLMAAPGIMRKHLQLMPATENYQGSIRAAIEVHAEATGARHRGPPVQHQ